MLTTLLLYTLMSNAITVKSDKSILISRSVLLSLLFVSYLGLNNLYFAPLSKGIGILGGLFNVTIFTQTFDIFILLISFIILTLNSFFPRKLSTESFSSFYNILRQKLIYNKYLVSNKSGEQFRIIEYPLIIIFILYGALFLISTNDLISIFLSIELQSYGLYIISTIYRDSESATASGLTYFLLGGLSSCFILLGSALLYVNSGTTSLENIYVITSISGDKIVSELNTVFNWYQPYYLYISLIVMSVGFLFKVSAAPFHFWSPDVYDGIPTVVTTYVAIVAKISVFAFLLELVYYTEQNVSEFDWKNILLISSLLSLIIGSILGLTQFRIKRLLAYSTISHVGFILLALSMNVTESIQSYIFYIFQYSLSNLNAFMILVSIGYSLYTYTHNNKTNSKQLVDSNNSPIQLISQIKGYFNINPFISLSLAITLFSFAGVPPMIGFFGKQMILSAAIDNGYIFMALIAILTSVIGAAYYLNLIKNIFFFKSDYEVNLSVNKIKGYIINLPYSSNNINNIELLKMNKLNNSSVTEVNAERNNITLSSSLTSIISIITLILLLFICMPEQWFNLVNILSLVKT